MSLTPGTHYDALQFLKSLKELAFPENNHNVHSWALHKEHGFHIAVSGIE